ncbi:hypothetical protein QBC47DRAFT_402100 [Echria macrotheca]|uniref:Uncharacterized protein n=1 Tax=Echria macrotheca TaxID=438768 RepID=A0AAJ0FA22_9PEZI|nr:hypothetical protein QBC47DRAFT_402100 [Echria macrotheca]
MPPKKAQATKRRSRETGTIAGPSGSPRPKKQRLMRPARPATSRAAQAPPGTAIATAQSNASSNMAMPVPPMSQGGATAGLAQPLPNPQMGSAAGQWPANPAPFPWEDAFFAMPPNGNLPQQRQDRVVAEQPQQQAQADFQYPAEQFSSVPEQAIPQAGPSSLTFQDGVFGNREDRSQAPAHAGQQADFWHPLGLPQYQQPLGVADQQPLGVAGQQPLGIADRQPLGVAGLQQPLGVAQYQQPLGVADHQQPGEAVDFDQFFDLEQAALQQPADFGNGGFQFDNFQPAEIDRRQPFGFANPQRHPEGQMVEHQAVSSLPQSFGAPHVPALYQPYGNQPYGNQPYGNQPYGSQPYGMNAAPVHEPRMEHQDWMATMPNMPVNTTPEWVRNEPLPDPFVQTNDPAAHGNLTGGMPPVSTTDYLLDNLDPRLFDDAQFDLQTTPDLLSHLTREELDQAIEELDRDINALFPENVSLPPNNPPPNNPPNNHARAPQDPNIDSSATRNGRLDWARGLNGQGTPITQDDIQEFLRDWPAYEPGQQSDSAARRA